MVRNNKNRVISQSGMKRALAILSMAFLSLLAVSGNGLASDSDKVMVIVNGQKLRAVHFDRVMSEIMPMSVFHGGVSKELKDKNRKKAIERLIDDELLYQEAKRLGIKPDRKIVNDELKAAIERVGGKEKFKEALVHYGIDEKEFKRTLAAPGMVRTLLEKVVDNKATVSDREIRDYYENNRSTHFVTTKRRFRHIVFKVDPGDLSSWGIKEERAKDVLEKIREGADFEEMSRSFSEGVRKDEGGDTGYVARSQLLPELAGAGWNMKSGEVSDVVKTIYGYHIIMAVGDPKEETIPFEDARGQIESMLKDNVKKRIRDELMKGLRDKASIEVLGETGE